MTHGATGFMHRHSTRIAGIALAILLMAAPVGFLTSAYLKTVRIERRDTILDSSLASARTAVASYIERIEDLVDATARLFQSGAIDMKNPDAIVDVLSSLVEAGSADAVAYSPTPGGLLCVWRDTSPGDLYLTRTPSFEAGLLRTSGPTGETGPAMNEPEVRYDVRIERWYFKTLDRKAAGWQIGSGTIGSYESPLHRSVPVYSTTNGLVGAIRADVIPDLLSRELAAAADSERVVFRVEQNGEPILGTGTAPGTGDISHMNAEVSKSVRHTIEIAPSISWTLIAEYVDPGTPAPIDRLFALRIAVSLVAVLIAAVLVCIIAFANPQKPEDGN